MDDCDSTPLVLKVSEHLMTVAGICLAESGDPHRKTCTRMSDFDTQSEALEWASQHAMQFPGHIVRIQSLQRHYFLAEPRRIEGP